MLWGILILAALAFILFLAVMAIVRGHKNMKLSKSFETSDKKVKIGYWLLSAAHMWAGILIVLCYVIALTLIIANYRGA